MESMDIVLFYPIFLFISKVDGAVQSLNCTGGFQLNGTVVTLQCRVDSLALRWTLPPDSSTINFGAQDNLGATQSVNGFTAVLNTNSTAGEAPAISSITFTLIPSLNDTSITCGDTGLGGTSSCQLFVIGECQSILSSVNFETSLITGPPEIPIALQNTSSTFESVELQWSPPSFNGGSTITQYHINVSPPPYIVEIVVVQ